MPHLTPEPRKLMTAATAIRQLDEMRAFLESQRGAVTAAPEDINRFEQGLAELRREREWSHAMVLAVVADEPVPMSMYKPWACRATIWRWANHADKEKRLRTELLNGKTCVRPSDFFAALKTLGRGVERAVSPGA